MERVTKLGIAAIAIAALAAPVASAFASAEEPAVALTAEQIEQGRQLFNDGSCNSCHALADASSAGTIGPALDGNPNLTKEFTVDRITNGQGAMPSFGWMPAEDIELLANYIVAAKK